MEHKATTVSGPDRDGQLDYDLTVHMSDIERGGWELVTVDSFTADTGRVFVFFWKRGSAG